MKTHMPRDYYETLGVAKNASQDDIRKAFRRLARTYHPDVNDAPDAEDRFKEINEAYQVLSDDNRRAAYDRFGHAGVNGGGFQTSGFGSLDDILNEIFGGGFGFGGFPGFGTSSRRRRGPAPGRDLRYDMTIDFEQAIFGADIDIDLNRREQCPNCKGTGAQPGTILRTCMECGGSGQIRRTQQAFGFNMVNVSDCPRCRGKGKVVETPCDECRGSGIVTRSRTLTVKVPPGVDDGIQIRLAGEGEPSSEGGPTGDLYVVLHVRPHEFFKRRNNDIILEIPINIAQATLGDVVMVPTVDGEAELSIPAGTQSGTVIKLRDRGVPKLRRDGTTAGRGDQLVILTVQIPTRLNKEQRDLVEQLGRTLGSEIVPQKGRGFFDRVADFFAG
jgi:molecular chaperone DnaJ